MVDTAADKQSVVTLFSYLKESSHLIHFSSKEISLDAGGFGRDLWQNILVLQLRRLSHAPVRCCFSSHGVPTFVKPITMKLSIQQPAVGLEVGTT